MSLGVVCALVGGAPNRPDLRAETRTALAAQQPEPQVLEWAGEGEAAGVAAALATGADWIWLLDGVTVPDAGALAAFAAALELLSGLPEPLILAGKVIDATGALHPDVLPRHEIFEKQRTVDACERGLVHLRAAPSGSLLVRREAFARFGPLRTDLPARWSAFEFTARVLQSWEDTGYLVPASVAVRTTSPRRGRRSGALRTRARLLAGPSWTTTEKLWEGFLVTEEAVKAARGPARRA